MTSLDESHITKSALSSLPSQAEQNADEQQGVSRRNLLLGAAAVGGALAVVSGLAMEMQKSAGQAQAANPDLKIQTSAGGKLHEYWIQADSFYHNLVPTGHD